MNTNPTEHELSNRLAHEADRFHQRGGTELDISQVMARAGEIKRGRRMRATMLMAACVLAIAVPTALLATNANDHDQRPTPMGPVEVNESSLTLSGLEKGDAPRTGYEMNGFWRTSGKELDLRADGTRVTDVAPIEGGVMVATRNEDGEATARFVAGDGAVDGPLWPMEGGFAVSAHGNLVAFVKPDGSPVVVQADGTTHELPNIPRGTGFDAVAVAGEECSTGEEGVGCAVWVQTRGEKPESWVSTRDRVDPVRRGFRTIADVRDGELVGGITEVREDLSTCSAVEAFDQETPAWTTCDHRMVAFSPDGERVLATGSVGSGAGDVRLAILDSASGKPALDLGTVDDAYITQMIWEDDSHVLAVVFEKGRWAILRIGLDGSREYAVAPVAATDDVESPFTLPSS